MKQVHFKGFSIESKIAIFILKNIHLQKSIYKKVCKYLHQLNFMQKWKGNLVGVFECLRENKLDNIENKK